LFTRNTPHNQRYTKGKNKLEINSKENFENYSNIWRSNNELLNDQWFIGEIRKEI
jgi:hypothetical protein